MNLPWETLGAGGCGAVAAVIILAPLLRRRNGNGACPLPEHVAQLATHQEAIQTLKDGQTAIFHKLDNLPTEVAKAIHRK